MLVMQDDGICPCLYCIGKPVRWPRPLMIVLRLLKLGLLAQCHAINSRTRFTSWTRALSMKVYLGLRVSGT